MTKLEQIREKVIEAVPSIVNKEPCEYALKEGGCPTTDAGELCLRPIRLADVLRAIEIKNGRIALSFCGSLITGWVRDRRDAWVLDKKLPSFVEPLWDLRNDDLTAQTEETIEFLFNLLCV